ncbi:MAG: ribbon-helix-helix domain-containing protein [Gammaproteobacteria bacterium]|nr:ribbon-helix-helix domain-containing protein [Gammaproteobacteria bacterium]
MSNVRWSIVVREDVDKALRVYLGRRGTKKGDLSQFVEEAVQARLFELTVQDVKQRNRYYSQDEIMEAIDEALANG